MLNWKQVNSIFVGAGGQGGGPRPANVGHEKLIKNETTNTLIFS